MEKVTEITAMNTKKTSYLMVHLMLNCCGKLLKQAFSPTTISLSKKIIIISLHQELVEDDTREMSTMRLRSEQKVVIYLRDADQEAALAQGAEDPHERLGEIFQQDNVKAHKPKSQRRQELHYAHMF